MSQSVGRVPYQDITSQLFKDETVEGLVGVESPHHVVPVWFSHVDAGYRSDLGLALDVAGHVKPVTPPAFTVVGRGKKAVDKIEVSLVRTPSVESSLKLFQFLQGRRETCEVEGEAADQGEGIGLGAGFQTCCLQGADGKVVDLVMPPANLRVGGQVWFLQDLKGPVGLLPIHEASGRGGQKAEKRKERARLHGGEPEGRVRWRRSILQREHINVVNRTFFRNLQDAGLQSGGGRHLSLNEVVQWGKTDKNRLPEGNSNILDSIPTIGLDGAVARLLPAVVSSGKLCAPR